LATDLCARLNVDPNSLEISFASADNPILNLAEPYFEFRITPRMVRTLGDVSWDVEITAPPSATGATFAAPAKQKATINATARVWQTEVTTLRPVGYQQTIGPDDVQEKRVLLETLSNQVFLTKAQVVGQSAARDLRPGTVMTADMVAPVLLARQGELITVTIIQGSVQITAVAKALESGSLGQTIRARSDTDATKTFDVTLTGPQAGTVVGIPESSMPRHDRSY
jgi:flagella basal body P-ring formation protein FlgA